MILNRQNPTQSSSAIGATHLPNSSRPLIDQVIPQIERTEVREVVRAVFDDLLRLLDCLSLIENHLRRVNAAGDTFELFQLINDEGDALVKYIQSEVLKTEILEPELFETLDGIAFALKHDLQRVFESDSKSTLEGNSAHALVGRFHRAHDILTNCLQQSTITLSMVFDGELVGAKLFNNSTVRYRQSLQLCDAVSALIRHVENAEASQEDPSLTNLLVGIQSFRSNSLELLMYTDWPQFEGFCERINQSKDNRPELASILHQFRCYLETLLGQVKRRAVLANVFPLQFGGNSDLQRSQDPFATHVASREDEQSCWSSPVLAM